MVDNYDNEPLSEYEIQEMRDMERKVTKYQQQRAREMSQAKEVEIQNQTLQEVGEEFGLSAEEVQRTISMVGDADEAQEAADLYREGVKDFLRKRLSSRLRKEQGPGRMQDSKGRFTSPQKEETRRQRESRFNEIKQKALAGRASEDELLEAVKMKVGRLY